MWKDYQEFVKDNKVLKHAVNGVSRFLILWIIKSNESIHGYGIIKQLDKFFDNLIEEGTLKKFNSSKIYPILKDMENLNYITGEWKQFQNQKVKYYQITQTGEFVIGFVFHQAKSCGKNPQWQKLVEDFQSIEV